MGCRKMEIKDLESDTLRCIFGFVAQSGGENLARAITGKAAQSGSTTAQFLLAMIILMSSTQLLLSAADIAGDLLFSEDRSSSLLSYASDDEISDAGTNDMEEEEEDDPLASMFLSCFESAVKLQGKSPSLPFCENVLGQLQSAC
ncbi:hypothetical protein QQ045_030623 [Rhodiola kirilowii]